MSEENVKRPELNDAQLKDVSGGGGLEYGAAYSNALNICNHCRICKTAGYLAHYLQSVWPDKIVHHEDCPYYQQFRAGLGGIQ